MKRLMIVVLLCLVIAGCSGVRMNARYSQLLDKTVVLSGETAARARQGTLNAAEMTEALSQQAVTWKLFQDARDGKDSTENP